MAKAASPIRLQEELMQAAAVTGKRFHHSTAEQIEYWAEMGRRVATILDPDVLLSVTAGLATIKIEPVQSGPVNPDEVFQSLEEARRDGSLSRTVSHSAVTYQASITYPGYLERIDQNGNITSGKFEHGVFIPMTAPDFER